MPDRESQARRAAKSVGLYAWKPRAGRRTIDNRGGFTLMNPVTNTIIGGRLSEKCALSAEAIIDYCKSLT